MAMDLQDIEYDEANYSKYIYGSAEVVGLMCMKVFAEGDKHIYENLERPARYLGTAFQKVNFLRDVNSDFNERGRTYFPNVNVREFTADHKQEIEMDIESDFEKAKEGIAKLPSGAKLGVYLAYVYYLRLFEKIRRVSATRILSERIRIPNFKKILLLFQTYLQYRLRMI